jgi:hypothetical protein
LDSATGEFLSFQVFESTCTFACLLVRIGVNRSSKESYKINLQERKEIPHYTKTTYTSRNFYVPTLVHCSFYDTF